VLLSLGLSPTDALGTNKLQSSFGSASATFHYSRAGLISWRDCRDGIIATAIGAIAGSLVVQQIDPQYLRQAIPVLLIAIAFYLLFRPKLGAEEALALKSQLERAGLRYEWREVRDAAGALRCEAFVIDVDTLATAMLRGDYEAQRVEIDCQNFGVIGRVRYRLSRAEFDEFVWDLGKLMLGFPSAFAGRRLPE